MTAEPPWRAARRRSCLWLTLLLVHSPAMAWNAAGHRISALIAWERLDPTSRSALAGILRQHPDYGRWQRRAKSSDPDQAAFLEASTWPDDIRSDQRFYSAGREPPTPTRKGFPDMERRLNWHYVDRPLNPGRRAPPSAGRLDRQLTALAGILCDAKASSAERAYTLPWLIHLVGDAHQPLHAASRYGPRGDGDGGGNEQQIVNPFQPRHSSTNLHRYWDGLPGSSWLRGRRLESTVRALTILYPPTPTSPAAEPAQWIEESWRLAREAAYPPGDDAVPTISARFHANALDIAGRRVTEAGYRLADLLAPVRSRGCAAH